MGRLVKATLAGLLAAGLCLTAVAWSRAAQRSQRLRQLERDTRVAALQFATRLRYVLEKHQVGLQQMAAFFENSEEVTEEEFHAFASRTLAATPLCLRISVVDPSLRARWVHPREHAAEVVGFDVRTHPQGLEALRRAIGTREAALSAPLKLVGGADGFVLSMPAFRGERMLGAFVCAFRRDDFFSAVVLPEVTERYEERVRDEAAPLFAQGDFEPSIPTAPAAAESFTLAGRTWQVEVRPRAGVVRAQLDSGRTAFWTMGWLLALAAAGAVGAGIHRLTGLRLRLESQRAALAQTEQRLGGAMQQLLQAEKLTALGELVAGVAHEVNNPLASVLGYTQLALTRDLPPDVRRRLETVCSEAERAGRIVRNLLTFARKHPPEKRYLGLNGVIEKTLELKLYHFRVNQIRLEKDLQADLPMTLLDFHQIQQVLLNLLNNAEQAMSETGGGGTIRVTTRRAGERIELRVADSGPGIPEEIQGRIFEPFFTTKKEGKGTGLGLSLCYGIIQEHGGHIRVESRPGQGAAFIVELPLLQAEARGTEAAPPMAARPVERLSVLVIDDEPAVLGFLVDLLTSRGHRVDTASDVPEALRKLALDGHDLIITDMKMPGGTGRDIYQAVAARRPQLARRVVFTTGDGASEETLRFLREVGAEILLKPYRMEEIDRVISSLTTG